MFCSSCLFYIVLNEGDDDDDHDVYEWGLSIIQLMYGQHAMVRHTLFINALVYLEYLISVQTNEKQTHTHTQQKRYDRLKCADTYSFYPYVHQMFVRFNFKNNSLSIHTKPHMIVERPADLFLHEYYEYICS